MCTFREFLFVAHTDVIDEECIYVLDAIGAHFNLWTCDKSSNALWKQLVLAVLKYESDDDSIEFPRMLVLCKQCLWILFWQSTS